MNKSLVLIILLTLFTLKPVSAATVQLQSGWNMFSIPVSATVTADSIRSQCGTTAKIWNYNPSTGNYVDSTQLVPGLGYWVRLSSACTVNVDGSDISINDFPSFNAGWNQIGAPSQSIDFSIIKDSCNVLSKLWRYNPSTKNYESSDTLDPGIGYWIRFGSICNLVLIPPPPSTCPDDTAYGQCSSVEAYKPDWCDPSTGKLVLNQCNSPHNCPCPSDQSCNETTGGCYIPVTTACSSLSYPTDRWQRIWYTHSTGACLGNGPDQTLTTFDDNWAAGTVAFNKADDIQFNSSRTINLAAATYTFTLGSDDGARLWIDDTLEIDKWIDRGYTTDSVTLSMAADNHKFRIDYYENGGNAEVSFSYTASIQQCTPGNDIIKQTSYPFGSCLSSTSYAWSHSTCGSTKVCNQGSCNLVNATLTSYTLPSGKYARGNSISIPYTIKNTGNTPWCFITEAGTKKSDSSNTWPNKFNSVAVGSSTSDSLSYPITCSDSLGAWSGSLYTFTDYSANGGWMLWGAPTFSFNVVECLNDKDCTNCKGSGYTCDLTSNSCKASQNLLLNPSLETDSNGDGVPDYWTKANDNDVSAVHDWCTEAHTGSRAICTAISRNNSAPQWHASAWTQNWDLDGSNSPFKRGGTYEYRAWYQTSGGSMILYVGMWNSSWMWMDSAIRELDVRSSTPSTWTQSGWLNFTIPSDAAHIAVGFGVGLSNMDSGASIMWGRGDDFEAYQINAPVQQCLGGTAYGSCSSVEAYKPDWCDPSTGKLVLNQCNSPHNCPCPDDQSCNSTTGGCYVPVTTACDSTCKAQNFTSGTCEQSTTPTSGFNGIGMYGESGLFAGKDANWIATNYDEAQLWPGDGPNIAKIHAIKPTFVALLYRDMMAAYSWWNGTDEVALARQNNWLLKDSNGKEIASATYPGYYDVDFGNPSFQQYFAQGVKDYIQKYGFDGVMLDNGLPADHWGIAYDRQSGEGEPINPRTGKVWTDQEVIDAVVSFHNTLRAAIGNNKVILPNGIWTGQSFFGYDHNNYLQIFQRSQMNGHGGEGFFNVAGNSGSADQWDNQSAWKQDVDTLAWSQTNYPNYYIGPGTRFPDFNYSIYSVLLAVNGPHVAMGDFARWTAAEATAVKSDLAFTKTLGQPLGAYTYNSATGVYSRQFEHGTINVRPSDHSHWLSSATTTTTTSTSCQSGESSIGQDGCSSGLCCCKSDLVGYWKFDEGSGTTAKDSSPFKNDGTLYNNPTWTTGKSGNALQFNGVNNYIQMNNVPVNTATGANNTVAFWMYWNGVDSQMPFGWNAPAGYDLAFYNGGFGFNTGGGDVYGIPESSLANKWVHVAAIFPNGYPSYEPSLYINGVKQSLSLLVGTRNTRSATPTIFISGWGASSNYKFSGAIDEVKVWNRALSADEIKKEYNGTIQQCLGGTAYGSCSSVESYKPDWCDPSTGKLVLNQCNSPHNCPCPSDQSCNETTGGCYVPVTTACDSTCKAQNFTSGKCEAGGNTTSGWKIANAFLMWGQSDDSNTRAFLQAHAKSGDVIVPAGFWYCDNLGYGDSIHCGSPSATSNWAMFKKDFPQLIVEPYISGHGLIYNQASYNAQDGGYDYNTALVGVNSHSRPLTISEFETFIKYAWDHSSQGCDGIFLDEMPLPEYGLNDATLTQIFDWFHVNVPSMKVGVSYNGVNDASTVASFNHLYGGQVQLESFGFAEAWGRTPLQDMKVLQYLTSHGINVMVFNTQSGGAQSNGVGTYFHNNQWDMNMTVANYQFMYSLFLIGAESPGIGRFSAEAYSFDPTGYNGYPPFLNTDIGTPLGSYTQNGNILTREFTKSTITVDLGKKTGQITIKSPQSPNSTTASCQSGESLIGQDGCSSGLCCCSGNVQQCTPGNDIIKQTSYPSGSCLSSTSYAWSHSTCGSTSICNQGSCKLLNASMTSYTLPSGKYARNNTITIPYTIKNTGNTPWCFLTQTAITKSDASNTYPTKFNSVAVGSSASDSLSYPITCSDPLGTWSDSLYSTTDYYGNGGWDVWKSSTNSFNVVECLSNQDCTNCLGSGYTCNTTTNSCYTTVTTCNSTCKSQNFSSGNCRPSSTCSGSIALTYSSNPVAPSAAVTPIASGLSNCNGKTVYFKSGSCSGTQVSSCTVSGTGCSGSFTAPSSNNTYTYYACIDENGDNNFAGSGESSSNALVVAFKEINFNLADSNGKSFTLSGYQGNVVLVNFFHIGCGYCMDEMPVLKTVLNDLSGKSFVLMSLSNNPSSDTDSAINNFKSSNGYNWMFARDTSGVFSQYGTLTNSGGGVPANYIIDKNGFIRYNIITSTTSASTFENYINGLINTPTYIPPVTSSGGGCLTGETPVGQDSCPLNNLCCCSGTAQKCLVDGTLYGSCSVNKPSYCDNGKLVNACGAPHNCECPFGQICNTTTESCYIPVQNCSDGTTFGQCSFTKPKYCDSIGTLHDNYCYGPDKIVGTADDCGCSSGTCQSDGTCALPTCNLNGICNSTAGETVWNCCPDCGVPQSGCNSNVSYWYTCSGTTPIEQTWDCKGNNTACSYTSCADDSTQNGTYKDYYCSGSGSCLFQTKSCYKGCTLSQCCSGGGCVPEGTVSNSKVCLNGKWVTPTADLTVSISGKDTCTVTANLTALNYNGKTWQIKDDSGTVKCSETVSGNSYSYTCTNWTVSKGTYNYSLYVDSVKKSSGTVSCNPTCNLDKICETGETVWNCCSDCGVPSSGCEGNVSYSYMCDNNVPIKHPWDCKGNNTACSYTSCADDSTQNGTYKDYYCSGSGSCLFQTKSCYKGCTLSQCCSGGGCVPGGTLDTSSDVMKICNSSQWLKALTVDNLLSCIMNPIWANATLHTLDGGCGSCEDQESNFILQDYPVGPSKLWTTFNVSNHFLVREPSINDICDYYAPCWTWDGWNINNPANYRILGCTNLTSLNTIFGCGLMQIPTATYKNCCWGGC